MQTVKALLTKAEDPHLAMLAHRATPLQQGQSPAELLMGHELRTTLPFDRMYQSKNATPHPLPAQPVWVKPSGILGTVVRPLIKWSIL